MSDEILFKDYITDKTYSEVNDYITPSDGLELYTIVTPANQNDEVYNFLTNELSGTGTSLSGSQICKDRLSQSPVTLSFKLSAHQVQELQTLYPEVRVDFEEDIKPAPFDFSLVPINNDNYITFAGMNTETIMASTFNAGSFRLENTQFGNT